MIMNFFVILFLWQVYITIYDISTSDVSKLKKK